VSYIRKHLMPGEEVVTEAHLNRIVYMPAAILLALAILQFVVIERGGTETRVAMPVPVLFAALAVVAAIPAYVRRSSSEFAVTNRRVVVKVGFLRRHSTEILLRQVEGITVDQGILGRILGYGTIIVEGTGSDRTPYRGIAAPLKFRLAVQEQVEKSLSRQDGAAPQPAGPTRGDSYSELLKLSELKQKGILTDDEFVREKRRILGHA
jgi:uncharacterized membrane protein YdbT with pleckstrin-like domain